MPLTDQQLDLALKALASRPRREILCAIDEAMHEPGKDCCNPGEICASKLCERVGLSAPTISYHTTVLVGAGLVDARSDGKWVYYSLVRESLHEVAASIVRS